jgi:hypothetical protein
MPLLNQIGRSLSIFMGITAPKPEKERLFGILILVTTVVVAAGSVVLFLLMVRMLIR